MDSRRAGDALFATFPAGEADTPARREGRALVERAVLALAETHARRAALQGLLKSSETSLARSVVLQAEVAVLVAQLYAAAETLARAERADGQSAEHLVASLKRIVHQADLLPPDMQGAVEADVVSWAIDSYYEAA